MHVVGRGVDNGVIDLTPTGSLWANVGSKIAWVFTRDKRH
jgi:hypothetical protein